LSISAGTFACSNVLNDGAVFDIQQTGGALIVTNQFSFGGYYPGVYNGTGARYAQYLFAGGALSAGNIELAAEWIISGSGESGRITNPGSFKMGGTLRIGDAHETLGRFILASNAVIDLGGGSAKLSFAKSTAEQWAHDAILIVTNWNGSPTGGGDDQLKFGSNISGVTAEQLGKIRFISPAGFPPSAYLAQILATGEVVPMPRPSLAAAWDGKNLILHWAGDFLLQTSTNAAGPYMDLPRATSPFTNDMTASPQQFFRSRAAN